MNTPYVKFDTAEDFNIAFEKIWKEAYSAGYEAGALHFRNMMTMLTAEMFEENTSESLRNQARGFDLMNKINEQYERNPYPGADILIDKLKGDKS